VIAGLQRGSAKADREASDVIDYRFHPALSSAVSAAVESPLGLDPVANDLALTVLAHRGEFVYRALEAVERMGVSGSDHLEGQVVVVAADFTSSHGSPPVSGSAMPPTQEE
jgi:hypothetical protein